MTTPSQPEAVAYRRAEARDEPALTSFACSVGVFYEDEVEQFIRTSALERALAENTPYRLLVFTEEERLLAVSAYHPEPLFVLTGTNTLQGIEATRLQLLALSLENQGRRLDDGRRLSDLVMQTLMRHALDDREIGVLTAIVARENLRSLALCERHGLTSQIEHGPRYARLSGRFAREGA